MRKSSISENFENFQTLSSCIFKKNYFFEKPKANAPRYSLKLTQKNCNKIIGSKLWEEIRLRDGAFQRNRRLSKTASQAYASVSRGQ